VQSCFASESSHVFMTPYINYMSYDTELNLDDDQGFGVGLGWQYRGNNAFEINYFKNKPKVDASDANYEIDLYGFDYTHTFFQGKTRPTMRIGAAHQKYFPAFEQAKSTDTLLRTGFGVAHAINNRLLIVTELQWQYAIDEAESHYGVQLGLNYTFGKTLNTASKSHKVSTSVRSINKPQQTHFDSDGDGIPNQKDACNEPVKVGDKVDQYGCIIK
ncbi:MAG: hypothetical protein AAGB12_04630, partial [Pseudomonadota bacterium]